MIFEATQLLGLPVHTTSGQTVGSVNSCVFDNREAKLYGFQVTTGLIKKYTGLQLIDAVSVSQTALEITDAKHLHRKLDEFDQIFRQTGPVLGVEAKTESGKRLGRVANVLVEIESGLIVRFYLKNLLAERIIPRQYLVSLNPKQVTFKDAVEAPTFDQTAAIEAAADFLPAANSEQIAT